MTRFHCPLTAARRSGAGSGLKTNCFGCAAKKADYGNLR
jgi:hypothetical protein